MADPDSGLVLDALIAELEAQGHGAAASAHARLTAYPIKGTIDVVALAEAVENALGGGNAVDDDGKTPAELNAANDG
jgi:hypothetical protein